ncbi:type II toxin-antitoxin system ParD family antitoxin [Sphingomonas oligophenolica]|uniref:Type II toxin-antitoxin system ParD family antitoxin n=2 Tax=Sphingomonas oligophenolica TaxID=301154 RepID=A0A502CC46_9SPHN|nr:type II toxin-antitoxin system ParD family antitoxin [Sphingomonas oligophenolica]
MFDDIGPMTELSVSMPPALQNWVDARLSEGRYADAAEYLRDLIRRDQAEDVRWVRMMIAEGEASGYLDANPDDIIDEIIAELPAGDG